MVSSKKLRKFIAPSILVVFLLSFSVPAVVSFQVSGLEQSPQSGLSSLTVSSTNWSGYAAATGTSPSPVVTAVYGSWVVQTVQASSSATYSSQWIGIGGLFKGDKSLIQTGSESDSSGGKTSYSVWWETLPQAETPINEKVSAGDVISASIVCISSCTSSTQSWTITLSDVTQGWTFATTLSYSSSLKSAEWIDERPSQCVLVACKLTTLADFGTASFGQDYTSVSGTGSATIGGSTLPIGSLPHAAIVMDASSGGSVIAQPSALSADGTSFTIQWK